MSNETHENRHRNVLLAVFVGLVCLFLMLTCAYQVRTTQAALVTTLGKPGEPVREPGLRFKAPWPFQRVYLFDQRTQVFSSNYREVITRSGSNLVVKLFVVWQVADPGTFYGTVGYRTEDGQGVLGSLTDKHSSDVIGRHVLADFVHVQSDGHGQLRQIEEEIRALVADEATKYGIAIKLLGFEQLQLPESITARVFERMIADRKRETQQIRSEGEYEAKTIRTGADTARTQKLNEAEATASKLRGQGDSEAYRLFSKLKEDPNFDPEFTLFLRKLDALDRSLRTKTTIFVDRDVPPYDLLRSSAMDELLKKPAP